MGEEDQVKIKIVDDAEKILEDAKSEVLKAVVADEDEEKIQKLRDSIMETGIVSVSQSMRHNLEVMNKGVTKGNCRQDSCRDVRINREK